MTDRPGRELINDPDIENSEQHEEPEQAHSVAEDALRGEARDRSPLDSIKARGGIGDRGSEPDLIDRMRDMEQSGRIDMGAFEGEPNFDDDEDKYGDRAREDNLPDDEEM